MMIHKEESVYARLAHLEANHLHMRDDLLEIKEELKELREEIGAISTMLSEKRGALNMRRTLMYGAATFLSVCAAFGVHEWLPWR